MIEGSEAQKQRPYELLWMLWFDGKSISNRQCTKDRKIMQKDSTGQMAVWFPELTLYLNFKYTSQSAME